jgi:hypothetical protein
MSEMGFDGKPKTRTPDENTAKCTANEFHFNHLQKTTPNARVIPLAPAAFRGKTEI